MACFFNVIPDDDDDDDRVFRSERHDKASFKLMSFCKVEAGRLCWIYPVDRLMPLPNVE